MFVKNNEISCSCKYNIIFTRTISHEDLFFFCKKNCFMLVKMKLFVLLYIYIILYD